MAENRVIHWFSGSTPCFKALFALEEKRLEYESKLLDFSKSTLRSTRPYRHDSSRAEEHKSEEVLAINPRGQLPAFKDGDAVVNESAAILLYLESQYPEKPLVPSDAATKARVRSSLLSDPVGALSVSEGLSALLRSAGCGQNHWPVCFAEGRSSSMPVFVTVPLPVCQMRGLDDPEEEQHIADVKVAFLIIQ